VRPRRTLLLGLSPLLLAASGPCDPPVEPDPVCDGQGVETTLDVAYRDGSDVALDPYAPVRDDGCDPIPIVVYLHGGGFVTGDKGNRIDDKVELFTGQGWAFASVNYRLAPDAQYPGPEEDVDRPAGIARGGQPAQVLLAHVGSDPAVWEEASPQHRVGRGAPRDDLPSFLLVTRGTLARRASNATFAAAIEAAGGTAEVVDARPLTHEEVNEAVGQEGDTLVTPPLLAHLDACL
jgi:acetyl esterase/lipase